MIEINFVPFQLQKKKKRASLSSGFKIPQEIVIGFAGGVLMLMVLVLVILLLINFSRLAQHKALEKKWADMAPVKANTDGILNELRGLQNKQQTIEGIIAKDNRLWARKLNTISDTLPREVWLKKIALTEEMLFIEGSAISKQRKEMGNVHNFVNNLKADENFLTDLSDFGLGSIKNSQINKVEVSDFVISAKIKK